MEEIKVGDYVRREIACFNYYGGFEYLTLQELQAIYKKCQELGWCLK